MHVLCICKREREVDEYPQNTEYLRKFPRKLPGEKRSKVEKYAELRKAPQNSVQSSGGNAVKSGEMRTNTEKSGDFRNSVSLRDI